MRTRLAASALFPFLLLIMQAACLHDPQAPPVPGSDMTAFKNGWEIMEEKYPLFEYKEVNWRDIADLFYDQAFSCSTEEELLLILAEMMGELEDPSLFIYSADGDTLHSFEKNYQSNVDMDVLVDNYLVPRGYQGMVEGFGCCDPGIFPYACFEYFPDEGVDTLATEAFDEFIGQCVALELPAIILDIRMNPGYPTGSIIGYSKFVMSRLLTKAKVSAVYRVRCGPDYGMLTDYHPWIQPGGEQQFDGTVYLLTGGACSQAAEDMAVNLSRFDNFVLLGDTTSGDVTITSSVPLFVEGGWYIRYGYVTVLTYDYQWVQDAGVPPDVSIESTPGDFAAGIDPVLEQAIDMLEN